MRFSLFVLLLIGVQSQAQKGMQPLTYSIDDFAYVSSSRPEKSLQTSSLFEAYFRQYSRINDESSKDLYFVRDKPNQITIFLREAKEHKEVKTGTGDKAHTTFESVDTFIPTTFFKEKETIYRIYKKDTTAAFSLTDTLYFRPSADFVDNSSQAEKTGYRMTLRGGGTMNIGGEKREYWLFVNEFDSDKFPCYEKSKMSSISAPDMAMYNEIYIDCETLLPLKKMVYVMACKSEIPATLAAAFQLKNFPKNQ